MCIKDVFVQQLCRYVTHLCLWVGGVAHWSMVPLKLKEKVGVFVFIGISMSWMDVQSRLKNMDWCWFSVDCPRNHALTVGRRNQPHTGSTPAPDRSRPRPDPRHPNPVHRPRLPAATAPQTLPPPSGPAMGRRPPGRMPMARAPLRSACALKETLPRSVSFKAHAPPYDACTSEVQK